VVVLGAGPAGLTAAYELTKLGVRPLVLEKGARVGGLARTEIEGGYRFDLGGHRFFTKVDEVKKMWREVLGDDFLRRPRLSRIYYNGRFFHYPLRAWNVLAGLGLWQSLLIALSYLRWQLFPYRREDTFEQWVTNRFGHRLYRVFFETYTEKIWGIACSELKAEWAAQRIRGLSLRTVLLSMFVRPRATIVSLIEEFEYPRHGPGMMWSAVRDEVERRGGTVRTGSEVLRIRRTGSCVEGVLVGAGDRAERVTGTSFISSIPVTELVQKLDPPAPPAVLAAAERLTYRDFLTVVLVVGRASVFPDNWIYVHDPAVRVGRIQNFKNWSAEMVPDPAKTSLGLEYFCSEGDTLWSLSDEDLVELGRRELGRIGLARAAEVERGWVVRVPKAYPVYDSDYREALAVIRGFLAGLDNLQTVGRNGLHRYNNQDHAMLTGMLAARNLVLGQRHDLWSVNTERDYHEELRAGTEVEPELETALEGALTRVFRRVDRRALGLAVGAVSGISLALMTLAMVAQGDFAGSPGLWLLSHYFPGYRVTLTGTLVGAVYGFATGFVVGWGGALLRNAVMLLSLAWAHRRAEFSALRRFLEYL
jgi:protoporphyrinogen oxidase